VAVVAVVVLETLRVAVVAVPVACGQEQLHKRLARMRLPLAVVVAEVLMATAATAATPQSSA
jgi:hypothetical protein